jgi:hypothetical protein
MGGTADDGTGAAGADRLPTGGTLVEAGNRLFPAGAPASPVVGEDIMVPGAIWMFGPVTPPEGALLNMVVVLVTGMTGATGPGAAFWIVADAPDRSLPAATVPTGAGFDVLAGADAEGFPPPTAWPEAELQFC